MELKLYDKRVNRLLYTLLIVPYGIETIVK